MDYRGLAQEYFAIQFHLAGHKARQPLEDLTRGEMCALAYINKRDGACSPRDLSLEQGISTARVAAVLKALERKGYIRRQADTRDRRRTRVMITPEGASRVDTLHAALLRQLESMLRALGEPDAQDYVRISRRILDIMVGEGDS